LKFPSSRSITLNNCLLREIDILKSSRIEQ
jgi:hypothetical protein